MTLRTVLQFSCDMPFDGLEDGRGEWARMPGYTVLQAVRDILVEAGFTLGDSGVENDFNWYCWIGRLGFDQSFNLSVIDGIVIAFIGPQGGGRTLFTRKPILPHPDYLPTLERIGAALAADPRFSDLGWFSQDEFGEAVGAPTPAGAFDPAPCTRRFEATPPPPDAS
jgi:hypothetical protein